MMKKIAHCNSQLVFALVMNRKDLWRVVNVEKSFAEGDRGEKNALKRAVEKREVGSKEYIGQQGI